MHSAQNLACTGDLCWRGKNE